MEALILWSSGLQDEDYCKFSIVVDFLVKFVLEQGEEVGDWSQIRVDFLSCLRSVSLLS